DRQELRQFVCTLYDARQGLTYEFAMSLVPSHLAYKQQRNVTELHLHARLNGQGRNFSGFNLWYKLCDAIRDLSSIFVELILPQHACEHCATELGFHADV